MSPVSVFEFAIRTKSMCMKKLKTRKKRKYGNQRNCNIHLHL